MSVFGRTPCKENRNWSVKVVWNTGDDSLTEQLNEKEAFKFYKELKEEISKNKNGFIEVVKNRGNDSPRTFFINLNNVECFKVMEGY